MDSTLIPTTNRVQARGPAGFKKGQKAKIPDIGKLKGDVVTIDSDLQPSDRLNPLGWYWVKFSKGGRIPMKAEDLRPLRRK